MATCRHTPSSLFGLVAGRDLSHRLFLTQRHYLRLAVGHDRPAVLHAGYLHGRYSSLAGRNRLSAVNASASGTTYGYVLVSHSNCRRPVPSSGQPTSHRPYTMSKYSWYILATREHE